MYVISISHKKAPLEVRSRFAFSVEEQLAFLHKCRESTDMCHSVILSTCNRMELYTEFPGEGEEETETATAQRRWERMERAVCEAKDVSMELCRKYGNCYYGEGALRHLHRVASGVDSMVMGEDEILGQVKDAYYRAMEAKCTDFVLNTVFRSAITCAKKIKTDTSLSKTSVSVATLAAGQIMRFLRENGRGQAKVMIIGITGATGNTIMKNIRGQSGIHITGTSRRHGADGQVVGIEGVEMVAYEDRYGAMGDCDVIISATGSPHYTVTYEAWRRARESAGQQAPDRVLWLDLSVPADIDNNVAACGGLYQMDYFHKLARSNNEKKQQAKKSAEHMIGQQLDVLKKELLFHRILPEIPALKGAAAKLSFEQILYRVRDEAEYEEMKGFFAALRKALKDKEEEGQ